MLSLLKQLFSSISNLQEAGAAIKSRASANNMSGVTGRTRPDITSESEEETGRPEKRTTTEERSDTESPVGPVKSNNPAHSYVNLPQNGQDVHSDTETPPPLVAKKERSR